MVETQSPEETIELAIVGMVDGNGHPYSWSAIVNGYDPAKMADCPYPVIPEYLGEQPLDQVSIPNVSVSHIWTDNPEDARDVAACTYIENIVDKPEEVIGEVDGIIIPTDDGDNHVSRVKPFIGTSTPVFVDKPLATNTDDLRQFIQWYSEGHPLASSSAVRYAPKLDSLSKEWPSLGEVKWLTNATHKTWKRYGIHRLEPISGLLGPGFKSVNCISDSETEIYTITHRSGSTISVGVHEKLRGGAGRLTVYGTKKDYSFKTSDTYAMFRHQLLAITDFVRTGKPDIPFEETVDLMACIIAGRQSKKQNKSISVSSIYDSLPMNPP